ncbi:substrate-binding domain-containing protein [Candidatus Bathyarchaeota archaeon]|nr:substrate-binding domain-containing protein [Candidatus Bathyarchaeota archaeon]
MKLKEILIPLILCIIIVCGFLVYEYLTIQKQQTLILATTTSTFDSGLLDYLLPFFEKEYDVKVKVLAKGSGEAIEIAKRGDADVVLMHVKQLEDSFVNDGYGVHRVGVMYNDFVLIGPKNDPAKVKGLSNASYAFQKIFEAGMREKTVFISRADKSGTHIKELSIWSEINVKPSDKNFKWYIEAGAGMGAVLRMTNEKQGYTLTDRGTWLSFKNQLNNLEVLVEGDLILMNPYSIIPVNPEKYPQRNYKMAVAFAKFLVSEKGQKLIESFKKDGETLFYPMARDFNKAYELGFPNQELEIAWYDSINPYSLLTSPFTAAKILFKQRFYIC